MNFMDLNIPIEKSTKPETQEFQQDNDTTIPMNFERLDQMRQRDKIEQAKIAAQVQLSPEQVVMAESAKDRATTRKITKQILSLKQMVAAAQSEDERRGGTFSTSGSGDFKKDILKIPEYRDLFKRVYERSNGRKMNLAEEGDFEDTIGWHMSGRSNNITKMVIDAASRETPMEALERKAALEIFRTSDWTPEQLGRGTVESVLDPANIVTGGVAGMTAKTAGKAGIKMLAKGAPAMTGAIDGILSGAAMGVADEVTSQKAKEASVKSY